jgi:hypothetical protein
MPPGGEDVLAGFLVVGVFVKGDFVLGFLVVGFDVVGVIVELFMGDNVGRLVVVCFTSN